MKFLRHIYFSLVGIKPYFSSEDILELERGIVQSERQHACQVCISIEGSMPLLDRLIGKSCRERAWEIFSLERLWDTENNVGILILVCLADRNVEIVVDRGVAAKISEKTLENYCQLMESHFKGRRFKQGILSVLEGLTTKLALDFPKQAASKDELPNRVSVY